MHSLYTLQLWMYLGICIEPSWIWPLVTFSDKFYIYDQAWENRSYLHTMHLFVLWHLSPVLYVLFKFYWIPYGFVHIWWHCRYNTDYYAYTDKKLLHFNLSKSGQILHVDKTGFPRPGYICKFPFSLWYHCNFTHNDIKIIGYQIKALKGITWCLIINHVRISFCFIVIIVHISSYVVIFISFLKT